MRLIACAAAAALLASVQHASAAPGSPGPRQEPQQGPPPTGKPAPEDPRTAFTLQLIRNKRYVGRNGLEAMLITYLKYKKPLTPEIKIAMAINPIMKAKVGLKLHESKKPAPGELARDLTDSAGGTMWGTVKNYPPLFYDSEFVVPVQIGTPPQTIFLNLDTGSADL